MSKKLFVEIVSPERELWAGEGDMVIAKTTEGEVGVMPGHTPVLALLAPGAVVRVLGGRENGEVRAAVHGGFMVVSQDNRVSILAEVAELAEDIDVERAKAALRDVESGGLSPEDVESLARAARARSRLQAVGETV
ncbi:F0F1 ATP synthase subunit epsilon [Streptomonospora nanhaiensis]|uniref:ATP synthase epsilon chain n=1 Tax=Streptomonospora nanhaiensis TaxID=1323731 RepID=A0A853BMW6_9ACTN|nr:F0F1 ATP synthase subunit epsilon [Streptomonospora nanhaiensis]MBV2365302.1 F0F1 ATP synthase subunit epsilon [Streptomonospora nanhaiensis]MBX9390630.1 F0F1 ATP synthase subunit epsilon [Streptomonospora nanhaiensis]NYI95871.1 F-type H+-transporting ATPase subunit epsilon [Streptomonospora nanhaiensis]